MFEFDNGDPEVDPRLKIEEKMTNKQLRLVGIDPDQENKKDKDDKWKLSADGLFVEENKEEDDE